MADALWILVANASRARLFATDERAERWDLREEFQHLEHDRFARELAARLERGVNDHAFERLVIAAPPAFLGRMRKHISPRVYQRLMLDLNADYVNVPERELPERIPLA